MMTSQPLRRALWMALCIALAALSTIRSGAAQDLMLAATALQERAESPLAGVSVHGHLAFVGGMSTGYYTADNIGVRIVDLSDPSNPELVGRIRLRAKGFFEDHSHGDAVATYVATDAFEGTVAAVLDGVPDTYTPSQYPEPIGLWDVSDPAHPVFMSVVNLGMAPHGSEGSDMGDKPFNGRAMFGHYLFALFEKGPRPIRDFRLGVVDVSDPRNPVVVAEWQDDPRMRMHGLALNEAGTRAYIVGVWSATGEAGRQATHRYLYILDVSDPTTPTELGRYVWEQTGVISSLWRARPALGDSVVVLTDGTWEKSSEGSIHILDVSDPTSITKLAEFDTDTDFGMATDVAVREDRVYSSWMSGAVVTIDISDPSQPKQVSIYSRSTNLSNVALLGDSHVLASTVWDAGLYVLRDEAVAATTDERRDVPQQYILSQNYPNPFNPSTEIAFDLPIGSDVHLAIYDMTGREVATLVDRTMPAGRHRVRWHSGDTPSGLYLYRLISGHFTQTRRMVLLR